VLNVDLSCILRGEKFLPSLYSHSTEPLDLGSEQSDVCDYAVCAHRAQQRTCQFPLHLSFLQRVVGFHVGKYGRMRPCSVYTEALNSGNVLREGHLPWDGCVLLCITLQECHETLIDQYGQPVSCL